MPPPPPRSPRFCWVQNPAVPCAACQHLCWHGVHGPVPHDPHGVPQRAGDQGVCVCDPCILGVCVGCNYARVFVFVLPYLCLCGAMRNPLRLPPCPCNCLVPVPNECGVERGLRWSILGVGSACVHLIDCFPGSPLLLVPIPPVLPLAVRPAVRHGRAVHLWGHPVRAATSRTPVPWAV